MSLAHSLASSAIPASDIAFISPTHNPSTSTSGPVSTNPAQGPNAPIDPNNPPVPADSEEPAEEHAWWHDWDIDGPPAPKTFHSFSLLPLELQDTIWSLALSPFLSPSALQRSQFFSFSSYASDPFVGQVDSYKPLIQSPPAWKWYSRAEKEELRRTREDHRRENWHDGLKEGDEDKQLVIYAKPNRAAKWNAFFNFMWACKGSREVALEAWKKGIEGKMARDAYDGFTQRDMLKVLDSCIVRVARKSG